MWCCTVGTACDQEPKRAVTASALSIEGGSLCTSYQGSFLEEEALSHHQALTVCPWPCAEPHGWCGPPQWRLAEELGSPLGKASCPVQRGSLITFASQLGPCESLPAGSETCLSTRKLFWFSRPGCHKQGRGPDGHMLVNVFAWRSRGLFQPHGQGPGVGVDRQSQTVAPHLGPHPGRWLAWRVWISLG